MKKFVCTVCGYVHEGDSAPESCPICKAPASKFVEQSGEMTWAAEHVVGVAQGAPEEIMGYAVTYLIIYFPDRFLVAVRHTVQHGLQ